MVRTGTIRAFGSVVFPLGMYVVATHDYATQTHRGFLDAIPHAVGGSICLGADLYRHMGAPPTPPYTQWFGTPTTK